MGEKKMMMLKVTVIAGVSTLVHGSGDEGGPTDSAVRPFWERPYELSKEIRADFMLAYAAAQKAKFTLRAENDLKDYGKKHIDDLVSLYGLGELHLKEVARDFFKRYGDNPTKDERNHFENSEQHSKPS